jgi:hypothetical protein
MYASIPDALRALARKIGADANGRNEEEILNNIVVKLGGTPIRNHGVAGSIDAMTKVVDLDVMHNMTTLNVTPTSEAQTIIPESPVDGYSQVSVSAVTAAIDSNITLVLMHYNNITGKYNDQFICGSSTDNYQSLLDLYASTKRYASIKLIGHNKEYFTDKSKLYVVKVDNLDSKDCTVYITDNIEKMFKKYSEEVQRLIPIKFESYRVMADELTYGVTNAEFKFNNLGTYFNRPKE